jgi:hypothetical protein
MSDTDNRAVVMRVTIPGAGPVQIAIAVAPMTVPSVTASAAGGTQIALDYRETLNLLADTLTISHGRADAICQHLLDSAYKLAELTPR